MKSRTIVDEVAVKKQLEEATDWCGTCRICGEEVCGTLAQVKKHKHVE